MLFYIAAVLLSLFVYLKLIKPHKHWKNKGVSHVKPMFICGNMYSNLIRKKDFGKMIHDIYEKFPNDRYFGFYQFLLPALIIKDPDLIKQITVKDFDYFPQHQTIVEEDTDPLWGKNLVASKGKRWKELRPTLSPSFTSNKMKFMYTLMTDCSEQFAKFFQKSNADVIEVELKDVFTRYTNDVIATTAFGLKCDSLEEQNNEFYLMGKEAADFSGIKALKFFLASLSPWLMKALSIKMFDKKVATFFRKLIKDTIDMRTETGLVRQDMIHLLLEARKGKLKYEESGLIDTGFATAEESHLGKFEPNGHSRKDGQTEKAIITDDDITAQALIFFLAGFDTASILMCLIGYELALNTDIQDRLRQEIDDTYEECNGKVTYEAMMKMKYFDMVVSETLRKWPPSIMTDRMLVRPYTIEPSKPGEKPLHLENGSSVWLPLYSIHRDPNNYPDPDKFDPERFSDENKNNIKPYTFIPFGSGPRNCIGSRFAILENKTIFFHILRNFEIVPTKRSPIPLKLSPKHFNYTPVGGFWMGFKKRQI